MDRKLILISILIILLAVFSCKGKTDPGQSLDNQETEIDYSQSEEPNVFPEPEPDSQSNPLKNFSYSWSESDDMPPVVIIIDDFGNSAGTLLEGFADLPDEIVFAVLPDLPHTETAARLARKTGHEVIIHVPMEAESSSISPGTNYIKAGMSASEITEVMADFMDQIPMAIAANNHMGSKATSHRETMLNVIAELKNEGLFFIDSATTSNSAVFTAASELDVFSTRRDIFLDVPDISDATLKTKIESLGKYKGRNEPIVIISHCHNQEKLDGLRKFIDQIQDMGIKIVSLKKAFPEARA